MKKENIYSSFIYKSEIRKFQAISIEKRLQWLEDVNKFLDKAMSPKAKKIREAFRKGEL